MKYILITLFVLLIGTLISQVIVTKNVSETETISYKSIAKFDRFEIRLYPELTVATTRLNDAAGYGEKSRTGFRRIASYIFGGNNQNTQIAMTSPVQMDMSENSAMSFFMPADMRIDDLPQPDNTDVSIHKQPSKILAVIQFSGWASDQVLEEKFEELKKLLREKNIRHKDSYSYLGYNPPYQLVNRVNEVTIELIDYSVE